MDTNNSFERPPKSPPTKGSSATNRRVRFGRYFKHYRSGKIFDAWEYGHKAWPFGGAGKGS